MLSAFPELLNFGLVAPVILRAALGLILFDQGWRRFKSRDGAGDPRPYLFGGLQIAAGGLLVLGLFTQVVALVLALTMAWRIIRHPNEPLGEAEALEYRQLILAVALALLFLGAGFWAIDKPV